MSMLHWRFRERDRPALWYAQISEWLSNLRLNRRANWVRFSFPSAEADASLLSVRVASRSEKTLREREASLTPTPTPTSSLLIALEVLVLTSLVAAWIIPLFQ